MKPMQVSDFPIKYKGPIEASGVFIVAGDLEVRIIISIELLQHWNITNEAEALQRFAPIFIMSRGSRGIIGSEYELVPDQFKKKDSDEIMSFEEAIQLYTELATAPPY